MSDDMIGVPTALEDIEIGHEIEIPGAGRVTIRETSTTLGGPGGTVWTIALHYEGEGGSRGTWYGAHFTTVDRYLDTRTLELDASYGDIDAELVCDLLPALCREVRRLRFEVERRDARLHESRRMRTLAEEITGSRGGE